MRKLPGCTKLAALAGEGRGSMINAHGSPAKSQVRPSRTHVLPMAPLIWDFCLFFLYSPGISVLNHTEAEKGPVMFAASI